MWYVPEIHCGMVALLTGTTSDVIRASKAPQSTPVLASDQATKPPPDRTRVIVSDIDLTTYLDQILVDASPINRFHLQSNRLDNITCNSSSLKELVTASEPDPILSCALRRTASSLGYLAPEATTLPLLPKKSKKKSKNRKALKGGRQDCSSCLLAMASWIDEPSSKK